MRNPLGGSSSIFRRVKSFSEDSFIQISDHGEMAPSAQSGRTATATFEGMLVALSEAISDHMVESLVQFLLPHSTWTGLNALIQAQNDWLALHFGGENAIAVKRHASALYGQMVGEVVTAKRSCRKHVSAAQDLPAPYGSPQIERAFADKVLASLQDMPFNTGLALLASTHGAWILSCPEAIILQAPEFASTIHTVHTDDDLIQLMLEALELRLMLGHGG